MTLHSRNRHRGYTLIELLVVVVILITLVAIALPLARRVLDDSYTREASRQLNSYFAMAKVNAVRTGRPYGLFMQCEVPLGLTAGNTALRQITRLYLAEVQPPYAGGTLNARAQVYGTPPVFAPVDASNGNQVDPTEMAYLGSLIVPGETFVVRFDYKGEWYRCVRGISTNATYPDPTILYYVGTLNGLGYPLPPGYGSSGVSYAAAKPFQILRGPRRVGNPLELTGGTCLDLAYCGIGPTGAGFPVDPPLTQPTNVQSLTVMFTAAGGLEQIYVNGEPCTPQSTVHFLVGRVQKVNLPTGTTPADPQYGMNVFDPENSNLADPTAIWVSVSRSTGTVTTAENIPPLLVTSAVPNLTYQFLQAGANQTVTLNTTQPTDRSTYVGLCRQYATSREQMGGR